MLIYTLLSGAFLLANAKPDTPTDDVEPNPIGSLRGRMTITSSVVRPATSGKKRSLNLFLEEANSGVPPCPESKLVLCNKKEGPLKLLICRHNDKRDTYQQLCVSESAIGGQLKPYEEDICGTCEPDPLTYEEYQAMADLLVAPRSEVDAYIAGGTGEAIDTIKPFVEIIRMSNETWSSQFSDLELLEAAMSPDEDDDLGSGVSRLLPVNPCDCDREIFSVVYGLVDTFLGLFGISAGVLVKRVAQRLLEKLPASATRKLVDIFKAYSNNEKDIFEAAAEMISFIIDKVGTHYVKESIEESAKDLGFWEWVQIASTLLGKIALIVASSGASIAWELTSRLASIVGLFNDVKAMGECFERQRSNDCPDGISKAPSKKPTPSPTAGCSTTGFCPSGEKCCSDLNSCIEEDKCCPKDVCQAGGTCCVNGGDFEVCVDRRCLLKCEFGGGDESCPGDLVCRERKCRDKDCGEDDGTWCPDTAMSCVDGQCRLWCGNGGDYCDPIIHGPGKNCCPEDNGGSCLEECPTTTTTTTEATTTTTTTTTSAATPPPPPPSPPPGRRSGVFGDPHLSTFDRLRFDCQAAGEFVTVTSLEDPSFQIQERFTSIGSDFCSQASVSTGVAIADFDTPTVQISTPRTAAPSSALNTIGDCPISFIVDGSETTFGNDIGLKAEVSISGSRISIVHTETFVSLDVVVSESSSFGCHFLVQVFIPNAYRSNQTILGLLGTPNGIRNDDWRMPNGTVVTAPGSDEESIFSTSYNYCVDNWCIRNPANSIFTHGSGEFDEINGCDETYSDDIEESIANPSDELVTICGNNVFCLVDGVCGNLQDALQALADEEAVEEEQEEANPSPTSAPSLSTAPSMHPTNDPSLKPSVAPSNSVSPSIPPSDSMQPSAAPTPLNPAELLRMVLDEIDELERSDGGGIFTNGDLESAHNLARQALDYLLAGDVARSLHKTEVASNDLGCEAGNAWEVVCEYIISAITRLGKMLN